LASWFASNWWRLRWEPEKKAAVSNPQSLDWELSHALAASGGGYVWPPVTFSSDGYHLFVQCEGRENAVDEALSPVRYLNSFDDIIDASSFEAGVFRFIEQVLARLDVRGLRQTALHQLWSDIRAERKSRTLESKRRLEALLGIDPDEADDLIEGLVQWQRKVGAQALEEFAVAGGKSEVERILKVTLAAEKSVHTFSRLTDYGKIKDSLADKGSFSTSVPWKLGKETAYTVREIWGLGRGPVQNPVLADRLHLDESIFSRAHSDIPVAVAIRGPQEEQLKLLLKSTHPNRQRFDLARLIGDHVRIDAGDTWKPATHSMTARQKFQRAFAAEFLCPSDELYDRYKDTRLDIDDVDETALEIAAEYGVSQQLVLNHLANREVIDPLLWTTASERGTAYRFFY
jgi:hypothetical protein